MSERSGDDRTKIVHVSEPWKETQDPGDLLHEPRSISEIKNNLFSASPHDSSDGAENLAVCSENSQQLYAPTTAPDSSTSFGFSVHDPTVDDLEHTSCFDHLEERARAHSCTDSHSSGYVESDDSEHVYVENPSPHNENVVRHALIQRTTSGTSSLSSSLNNDFMRCLYDRECYISECKIYPQLFTNFSPSKMCPLFSGVKFFVYRW